MFILTDTVYVYFYGYIMYTARALNRVLKIPQEMWSQYFICHNLGVMTYHNKIRNYLI